MKTTNQRCNKVGHFLGAEASWPSQILQVLEDHSSNTSIEKTSFIIGEEMPDFLLKKPKTKASFSKLAFFLFYEFRGKMSGRAETR